MSETSPPAKLSKSAPSPDDEAIDLHAEPAVEAARGEPVGGAVLVDILIVEIEIERGPVSARAQHVGCFAAAVIEAEVRRRRLVIAAIVSTARVEQGILLQLLGDEALDLEIGQGQQPDRLLELRSHHQRLALPEVEARTDRHFYSVYSVIPAKAGIQAAPALLQL